MRALVVEALAADFACCAVREVPRPTPGEGQALVRVRAASVNFPDLLMTRGEYQFKPPPPFVPGLDLAGEVVEAGPGAGLAPGEAVVGGARLGAFAEYAVLDAAALRPKPARLSFGQAAAYGAAYLTAYVALVRRAQVRPGEWGLVHGAAGGVGLAAVDLAKALGCRVIAASASDEKLATVAAEYATDAVVNVSAGFRDQVKAITGGRGADVIYDPVGGDVFDESVRCIAFDGRLLVIGFTGGIGLARTNLILMKGASVLGVRAGEAVRQDPALGERRMAALLDFAEQGRLRPNVSHRVPFADYARAMRLLINRKAIGRVALVMD